MQLSKNNKRNNRGANVGNGSRDRKLETTSSLSSSTSRKNNRVHSKIIKTNEETTNKTNDHLSLKWLNYYYKDEEVHSFLDELGPVSLYFDKFIHIRFSTMGDKIKFRETTFGYKSNSKGEFNYLPRNGTESFEVVGLKFTERDCGSTFKSNGYNYQNKCFYAAAGFKMLPSFACNDDMVDNAGEGDFFTKLEEYCFEVGRTICVITNKEDSGTWTWFGPADCQPYYIYQQNNGIIGVHFVRLHAENTGYVGRKIIVSPIRSVDTLESTSPTSSESEIDTVIVQNSGPLIKLEYNYRKLTSELDNDSKIKRVYVEVPVNTVGKDSHERELVAIISEGSFWGYCDQFSFKNPNSLGKLVDNPHYHDVTFSISKLYQNMNVKSIGIKGVAVLGQHFIQLDFIPNEETFSLKRDTTYPPHLSCKYSPRDEYPVYNFKFATLYKSLLLERKSLTKIINRLIGEDISCVKTVSHKLWQCNRKITALLLTVAYFRKYRRTLTDGSQMRMFKQEKFRPITFIPFQLEANSKFKYEHKVGNKIHSTRDVRPDNNGHGEVKHTDAKYVDATYELVEVKRIGPFAYRKRIQKQSEASLELTTQLMAASNVGINDQYATVVARIERHMMKDTNVNINKFKQRDFGIYQNSMHLAMAFYGAQNIEKKELNKVFGFLNPASCGIQCLN